MSVVKNWAWTYPETVADREEEAGWSLVEESGFRVEIVERGRKRLRAGRPVADWRKKDAWVIPGLSSLGDQYPEYIVTLDQGRYSCTCWGHGGGSVRRRKICSHVVAVMIQRRVERGEAAPVESAPADARQGDDLADEQRRADWSTPRDLGLPFDTFRGVQILALKRLSQRTEKVLLLEAPTGSGKSLLAAALARILGMPMVYCATTKQLQDQFLASFPDARTLKGRANYTPLNTLDPEPGCEDPSAHDLAGERSCEACDKEKVADGVYTCSFCHDALRCPYELAKSEALHAEFAVLNTAYFLAEANHVGRFSDVGAEEKRKHPMGPRLYVLDEGDTLEDALMGFVSVEIGRSDIDGLSIGRPAKKDPKDKESAWRPWIEEVALPRAEEALKQAHAEACDLKEVLDGPADGIWFDEEGVAHERRRKLSADERVFYQGKEQEVRVLRKVYAEARKGVDHLSRLVDKLKALALDLHQNPDSWVRVDDEDQQTGKLVFKPVHVGKYAYEHLWKHGSRFLVMSATLLSQGLFCQDLGLAEHETAWVQVPSTFPVERRPVIYRPCGDMGRSAQAETLPKLVAEISRIVTAHPGDRILVHAVSYKLARIIAEGIDDRRRVVTFAQGVRGAREEALARYVETPGAVLIAPALERGVDLHDDLCNVVIVPKIPYANLGDRQVSHRAYGWGAAGKRWYQALAIRSICQATGRGMRHADDRCETFILDSAFDRLWREGRRWGLWPKWWGDAVVFESSRSR